MANLKAFVDRAPVRVNYQQNAAAGTLTGGLLFVSDGYYQIVEARASHDVNGGASAAIDVVVVRNGAAMTGTTMLASAFVLASGARTSQRRAGATLTATKANQFVNPGDSIGAVASGTLTAVAGVAVSIVLQQVRPNRQR